MRPFLLLRLLASLLSLYRQEAGQHLHQPPEGSCGHLFYLLVYSLGGHSPMLDGERLENLLISQTSLLLS
jgi:hypothetical protein